MPSDPDQPASPATISDRWGAFSERGFTLFWASRLLAQFSTQVVSVAVGWQVYALTGNPFDLGLVGLVQFAPALLLVLVTGTVSDRYNRRLIVGICQFVEGACALALLVLTLSGTASVVPVFVTLSVFGTARAFMNPPAQPLIPTLVPTPLLSNAIALSSASWQVATIVGPVFGGL